MSVFNARPLTRNLVAKGEAPAAAHLVKSRLRE